jgi:hypothetical protein
MANEILFSTLSGNARVSAVLHQTIVEKLADTFDLSNHPSILQFGVMNGMGSSALQVPVVGLNGTDSMAAVADGSAVSNTQITTGSATITIARQALRRSISDLANLTNNVAGGMGVGIEGLAEDMAFAYRKRATTMITALSSGFSTSVGSSGVNLSVSTFYDAIFALQLTANDGQFVAVLHPQQINDLISSLRSETGPGQYLQTTQDQVTAKSRGYRGDLFGVSVYGSTTVPTANAGADYLGAMFAPGAIGMATGTPAPIAGAGGVILPAGSPVVVELERDSASGLTYLTGSAYIGVAEIQDLKGVGILSDF